MIEDLSTEQFLELAEKLPKDMYEMLFAESTGNDIENICKRHKMEDDLDFMVNSVSDVLLGVLSPIDFFEKLKKESKATPGAVREAMNEINRFIFFPVKGSLEKIYNLESVPEDQNPMAQKDRFREAE